MFSHPDGQVKNISAQFLQIGRDDVGDFAARTSQYFVGDFDAATHQFKPLNRASWTSAAYYAPNCVLDPNGRRVVWGWINGFRADTVGMAALRCREF
jgi:sucrose-6-phosphate hydrolase SacC (GH32 family)